MSVIRKISISEMLNCEKKCILKFMRDSKDIHNTYGTFLTGKFLTPKLAIK
jgi:hypothetical protein